MRKGKIIFLRFIIVASELNGTRSTAPESRINMPIIVTDMKNWAP